MKTKIIQNIKSIILTLLLVFGVSYASAAWTNPPGTPPTCPDTTEGCNTPLNVSGTGQIKTGGLTLNTAGAANGLIVQNGKVGIGTATPTDRLTVAGGGIDVTGPGYGGNLGLSTSWESYGGRIQSFNSKPLAINPLGNNVGIGTSTPTAKLEVAGQVKITGGTPGAGKVLTSDAAGLATWETAGAGGGPTSAYVSAKPSTSSTETDTIAMADYTAASGSVSGSENGGDTSDRTELKFMFNKSSKIFSYSIASNLSQNSWPSNPQAASISLADGSTKTINQTMYSASDTVYGVFTVRYDSGSQSLIITHNSGSYPMSRSTFVNLF